MPKRGLRPSGGRRSLRPRSPRGQLVSDYGQRLTPSTHTGPSEAHDTVEARESIAPAPAVPTHGLGRTSHVPSASERPSTPLLEQALGHAHDDDAHLLADFFSAPPPAPEAFAEDEHDFDAHEVLRMSRGSRRAMWASLGLFGASILGIGSFIAYHQLVMPAPVELAGPSDGLSPLQPLAAGPETSLSAATDSTQPRYLLTAAASNPQPTAAGRMLLPGEAAPEPAAVAETEVPSAPPPSAAAIQPAALQPTAAAVSAQLVGAQPTAANAARAPVGASAQPAAPQPTAANEAARAGSVQPGAPSAAQPSPVSPPPMAVSAAQPSAAASAPAQARPAPVLPVPVQPLATGNSPEPTFDELLEVAHGFARRGNNETALDAFEHALRVRPDAPTALSGKALTYLNMDDTQSAKLYASRAVAADPTNSEGWIVLGAAEEQLGSREAAREAYKHCAEQGVGSYVVECRQLVR